MFLQNIQQPSRKPVEMYRSPVVLLACILYFLTGREFIAFPCHVQHFVWGCAAQLPTKALQWGALLAGAGMG